MSCMAWGQVDTIPFLKASLMIGEPSDIYPQTVFGHAFLRLQCPSAGLDNCFSMESGNYEGFRDICTGNYPNRLVAIRAEEYITSFDKEGRTLTEYALNLTQEEIQHLWQYLDEKVQSGDSPYHDFFHHGCSQEIIRFLQANIDGTIQYGERAKTYGNTLYALGVQTLPRNSLIRFPFVMLLSTDGTDAKIKDDEKTAVPYIIPDLFSDACIVMTDGSQRPVLVEGVSPVVHQPAEHRPASTSWPLYVWFALVLFAVLILSLVGMRWPTLGRVLDVLVFAAYLLLVAALLYVGLKSTLPTTSGWNWNYLIYNPVPLLVWLYGLLRKLPWRSIYLCYTLWILLFLITMFVVGGHYVLEQYLLALTFAVRCLFRYKGTKN